MQNRISILDCTLRDGGYVNQWEFGYNNIKNIIKSLVEANLDIVECGFLTEKVKYSKDCSRFNTLEQVSKVLPVERGKTMFVCMINYGEYNVDSLPSYDGSAIDGIRVAFHKKDAKEAMKLCAQIKEKGYKIFIQPMVTMSYSDKEVLELIDIANKIKPYAFYMADSFGAMKQSDIMRFFYLNDNNLDRDIRFGYHSHNNMQLAYSNAQSLCEIETRRNIMIDSSTFGMGRGAGNLNSEMFLSYLNDHTGTEYDIKPLLNIIDEVLSDIYMENYWGYSIPYYLSALHYCHPNYATYLDNKKTLNVDNIDDILKLISDEKRSVFDKTYIEELYISYMATGTTYDVNLDEFKKEIKGKDVFIIAPGKSVELERDKVIAKCNEENVITISVNFIYKYCKTDYVFVSNLRRYQQMLEYKEIYENKLIGTSNIPQAGLYIQTQYKTLLNNVANVEDNATLMLIRYLIDLGVRKIYIAGVDGYSPIAAENFVDKKMVVLMNNEKIQDKNNGLSVVLKQYSREVDIEYITKHRFVDFK